MTSRRRESQSFYASDSIPEPQTIVDGEKNGPDTNQASSPPVRLLVRNPHQTHFVGEVSIGTFYSQVQDAVVAESPELVVDAEYTQSLDSALVDQSLLRKIGRGFPPRNIADFLVQVFFHSVEANYYYMDRETFKSRLNHFYNLPNNVSADPDPSFLCLAMMVFAMGSQFAELEAPNKSTNVPLSGSLDNGPGTAFYLKAKVLVPDTVAQCSLESIQACFLMGLFLLPSNISDLSYVYHGMALKMAISAGLHRNITGSKLDLRILHVRNRLWWSLYTSERRLTIILDRPESIREEDIDAPLPAFDGDLDDSPQGGNGVTNLQSNVALTQIFNFVVRHVKETQTLLHVAAKTSSFNGDGAKSAIEQIQSKLQAWSSTLPWALQLNNLNPNMKSFRGAVHLHMMYNQIIIYMGRKSLLQHIQQHLKQRSASSASSPLPKNGVEAGLIQNCVAAAFKIVELLNYLWQNGKLARFSFTDQNCCSTAALIIMIHEIVQRHPLYRSSMETAMQTMSYMATGCRNAKQALQIMQRLTDTLRDRSNQGGGRNDKSDTSIGSHYREWESWMLQGSMTNSAAAPWGGTWAPEPRTLADNLGENSGTELEDGQDQDFELSANELDLLYAWSGNLDTLGLGGFDFEFPSS